MSLLRRISFTTRLVIVGVVALLVPVAIAYVAMLHLPTQVANTSVELTLRETSSNAQAAIREQRLVLREAMADESRDPEVVAAARRHAVDRLQELVSRRADGVRVRFYQRGERVDVGPVYAVLDLGSGASDENVVVYHPVDDALVSSFADDTRTPIAVTREGRVVASSKDFPRSIAQPTLVSVERDSDGLQSHATKFGNGTRHLFSRPIGLDGIYHLVVSSTPRLEHEALASPRRDIVRALSLLVIASLLITCIAAFLVNRSLHRFSRRASTLAAGDFDARLPERGNDAFGQLAGSFNSLADDLQLRMGQLNQLIERYTRTVESIEDGVVLWDGDEVLLWNRAAERMTGVAAHQLADRPELVGFLRGELEPGLRRVALPPVRGGARTIVDLTVSTVTGGGALQTMRDVTAVEQLDETRRNFMATASHELRTPLTSILGFAHTLRDERIELDVGQRERFLELIEVHADQMDRLLEAFLDNHRLANDAIEVQFDDVAIEDVLADAAARGRAAAPTPVGVDAIRVAVPSTMVVRADRRALTGALAIVLENALKYGLPPITISGSQRGSSVHLHVHDAGPGIDPHHVDRLFDPFYRVDPDMRTGIGGVGLGLFKARKLVEAMGGTIDLTSSPGGGTTVTFELRGSQPRTSRDPRGSERHAVSG